MSEASPPPENVAPAGARLWSSVVDDYKLDEHELALLVEACRTVDLFDEPAAAVRRDGVLVMGPAGQRPHPAAIGQSWGWTATGRAASGDHATWFVRRDAWMQDNGLAPTDYFAMQRVMESSRRYYGIRGPLERQWARAVGADEWRDIVAGRYVPPGGVAAARKDCISRPSRDPNDAKISGRSVRWWLTAAHRISTV